MAENMMCPAHKANNENYENNYDNIFRKPKKKKNPFKPTKKEIEDYKKTISKSNKISDDLASRIIEGKKRFEHWKEDINSSHEMTDWYTKIKAPAGTPRFYACRSCKNCGGEQYHHPAGKFKDSELLKECID